MVGVAQLVRAPGCGPGGRGFKSHHSPKHYSGYSVVRLTRLLWEQEIGSSNLSTPTRENTMNLCQEALSFDGAFCLSYLFILNHLYSKWRTRFWRTYPYPTVQIHKVLPIYKVNYFKPCNLNLIFLTQPESRGVRVGIKSPHIVMLFFR